MITLLPIVIIVFAALCGIVLAGYIRYKKTHYQTMTCPMHANCEVVTHSRYSVFLGLPVEAMGLAYYSLMAIGYFVFALFPTLANPYVTFGLLSLSLAAVIFSTYLTFIQLISLRQLCSWCLMSAGLCVTIFLLAAFGNETHLNEILLVNRRGVLAIHLIGLLLGLGGATITDLLFFRFLKDWRVSVAEADIMHTLSQVIWAGIILLAISGLGLYLPQAEVLNHSSKFLTKVMIVGVIIVNGAFLNLVISPHLIDIAFGPHTVKGEYQYLRRFAFALGAISFTSWWSAFGLGMTRSIPLPFPTLFLIYLGILASAIIGSQVMEFLLTRFQSPAAAAPTTATPDTLGRSATIPT